MANTGTEGVRAPRHFTAVVSLAVSLVAMAVFGSVVTAVGDWVEGRQLGTVAVWALPGLSLAVLAGLASMGALHLRKGHRIALALGLLVALSLLSLISLNPPIAPPVP